MKTPICDFVTAYGKENALRLHMPGHKGASVLGIETRDITEIDGADSLYEASGIILESERNAGALFGAHTLYSTEGSSQSIRAMLLLAVQDAVRQGKKPLIAAGRNAHKSFLSAVALLDLSVEWLLPAASESYLSCHLTPEELDKTLAAMPQKPTAVYLTCPDYLGNTSDIKGISEVCHRYGAYLLVDNAHGAYLKFLPTSRHPIDLGADLSCDSAHKTLPALTGAAYLHIAHHAPQPMHEQAKSAMALFGSTSPSYVILQSLDALNPILETAYPHELADFCASVETVKQKLIDAGYPLLGNEPLKLTLAPKAYGYTGIELAALLGQEHLVCEFADPDAVVMMLTPSLGKDGLARLCSMLCAIPRRTAISSTPPGHRLAERVCSVREAMLAPARTLPACECLGCVLASPNLSCPPAVPIALPGERIDQSAIEAFQYYRIKTCAVLME